MISTIKKAFRKSENGKKYKASYSQYGEDQIISALIYLLDIKQFSYLDIGANHPFKLNNTAIFYENGIHGINIEPDPENYSLLKACRPEDINLNIGISNKKGKLNYYRFNESVYNTFSYDEYQKLLKKPDLEKLDQLEIEVKTYNEIVHSYLNGIPPTILFIDTEGLDEVILESIDFEKYPPEILCVETFSFGNFKKDNDLIKKISNYGYTIHADTFVNTIFVKNSLLPYKLR